MLIKKFVAVALLALTACQGIEPKMSPAETQNLQPLLSSMRTVCFGRYAIDLPAAMQWSPNARTTLGEVSVKATPISKIEFNRQFDARKAELSQENVDGRPMLGSITRLDKTEAFIIDHANNSTQASRQYELWAWREGIHFKLVIKHDDATQATMKFSTDKPPNGEQQLKKLKAIFAKIRGRAESEIPRETGFCFPNGFYAGSQIAEELDGLLYLKSHTDINLEITSENRSATKSMLDNLPRRLRGEHGIAAERNGKYTLERKGTRVSNGLELEEVIGSLPTQERFGEKDDQYVMGITADAKYNALRQKSDEPWLLLTMRSGVRLGGVPTDQDLTKASLSQSQAIALWDAIIPTLNIRDKAF